MEWEVTSLKEVSAGIQPNLCFINMKNIAVDIVGHIVIDHKKYTLNFMVILKVRLL